MWSSESGEKKPPKDVEKLSSKKTKMERLRQETAKSRQTMDGRSQLYQSGMENTYVAIAHIDKDYKILMVNNAPGVCFDKPAGELVGRECFREFEKRQSVCSHCPGKRAMETGHPAQTRTERVLDDGSRYPVIIQAFPTINPDGEVAGFIEIVEDITKRIKTEEKLRESEGQLHTLFESTREGLLTAAPDGRVINANPAAAHILGYKSPQDLIGKYTADFYADLQQRKIVLKELEEKGYVKNFEVIVKRKDDSQAYLLVSITIQRDEEGNITRTDGIFRDITERKKAELSLRKERDKAQKYLDVADVMIVAVDSEQRVGLINKKGCEILGYEEEEIVGKNWFNNFLPERIRDEVREILRKLVQDEPDTRTYRENLVLTKSGEERLIAWHNTILRDEKGGFLATLSSGQDVTESKKAQEQIVKLARFPAENPSPVLRITGDGTIIYANNSSSSLLKAWRCGVGRSLPERWKKVALNALSTGQCHEIEVKCDGRTFSLTFAPVMDYNYVNTYGLDITERKEAEEDLRDSESTLRAILAASPVGIGLSRGRIIQWCNESMSRLTGYSKEYIEGRSTKYLYESEEEYERIGRELYSGVIEKGVSELETSVRCKDGRIINCYLQASPIDINDVSKGIIGVLVDITKRKKAEEALRQEHNLLRLLIDNIPDRIYVKDKEHRFILGNETVVRYEGFQSEEGLIGKTDFDLYPKELAESFYAEEREVIRKNQPVINREGFYLDKQGNEEWTLVTKVPLRDEGGNTIGLVGINRDITEHKNAEESLRESENKYRELANSITDVFFAMDTDLRYTYWNKASEDLTGIKAEDALGKTIFEIFPDTEDTRKAAAVYRDVLKIKQPKSFENEYRFEDKHYFFEVNAYPNESGISVFAKDMTERRRAEEALRTSEARLSDAVKIAKIGYWEYDVANELFIFNDQFYSVYRTSAERVGGYKISPARYAELFLHPDDVADLHNEIEKAIETADPNFNRQVEHRFIYGDGEIGYISARYFAVKDNQGRTIKTYGANQDITERKRAEEALRIAEERFSKAFHAGPDAMTISRMEDGTLFEVNDMWEKTLGYSRAESVGTSSIALGIWSDPAIRQKAVQQLQETGSLRNFETDLRCKTGNVRQVSLSSEHLEIGGEQCLLTIIHDITVRRKAEESLRKSEEHYRMLAETMNDGLTHIDENGIKVYVNKKCAEMFGYSPGEMLGKHWSYFYDESARKIVEEQLAKRRKGIAEPYEVIGTRKDGHKMYLRVSPQSLFDEHGKFKGSISILTDISERKQAESEKQLSRTILEISSKHRENVPLLQGIVTEIQKYSDCEAVGLRVLDEEGNIPYEAYVGFSKRFYESESPLSIKSDKCMCINVIKGDTNPELPFYTDGGSFYMNGTTRFLATVSEQDKGNTRNVCNEFGYESVALIPIFLENRIHGIIHLADTRENMVPLDMVRVLERIARQLGSAIQRVLAEEALMESENKYSSLIANIPDVSWTTDRSGHTIFISSNVKKVYGYSPEEIYENGNKLWFGRIHPDDIKAVTEAFREVFDKGKALDIEYRIKKENGEWIWLYDRSIGAYEKNGIKYADGVFSDITERKMAENELVEDQVKLKAMASKILLAEEHEKRRLAIGLHDNVCQKLVFAKLALESSLKSVSDSEVLTSLKNACENIGETIHEAESLTFELSNPILREFGFIAALEKYLTEEIRQKHGIEYELEKGKRIGSLQDEIKTCLFRVTRELLTNVVKHARAKKIKISVRRSRGLLNVSIQDDGVGFDTGGSEEVSKTRFGLFSVREQLEYIGGYFEIESEPGQGTNVTVIVPLRKKSNSLNSRGK